MNKTPSKSSLNSTLRPTRITSAKFKDPKPPLDKPSPIRTPRQQNNKVRIDTTPSAKKRESPDADSQYDNSKDSYSTAAKKTPRKGEGSDVQVCSRYKYWLAVDSQTIKSHNLTPPKQRDASNEQPTDGKHRKKDKRSDFSFSDKELA